jgi:thioredoxin reductase
MAGCLATDFLESYPKILCILSRDAASKPTGLIAWLYFRRVRLNILSLDELTPGGTLLKTEKIEDYPGFETVTGAELAQWMEEQARMSGAAIKLDSVADVPSQIFMACLIVCKKHSR